MTVPAPVLVSAPLPLMAPLMVILPAGTLTVELVVRVTAPDWVTAVALLLVKVPPPKVSAPVLLKPLRSKVPPDRVIAPLQVPPLSLNMLPLFTVAVTLELPPL